MVPHCIKPKGLPAYRASIVTSNTVILIHNAFLFQRCHPSSVKDYEALKTAKSTKRKLQIEDLLVSKRPKQGSSQTCLTDYVHGRQAPKQEVFEEKLQKFIVNKMLPLSIVESQDLVELIKCMYIKYKYINEYF